MNDLKQKTLLLVEDEIIIAMLEKQQLENEGYKVIHTSTGEKAIDIISESCEPIDLILMDIDLGSGIDGTEAARRILAKCEIPVIFLSSHTEKEVVQKTEKITSYGYVVKNSGITVLDASIKMAFKLFAANKKTETQKEQLITILNSIGDAVIATDTAGNVILMNPVAANLTGWDFAEAEGKPLKDIFRIINAHTRESVENPVYRVLNSGKIVGLANHTILISRNNTEYQIADSGSPIMNAGCRITGVVLVFRDVTREYEIQSKIEKSGKMYRFLFENMLNGFAYCKMLFEQDEPVDFVYLSVNMAFEKLTGLKEVAGRKVSEVIPGIRETDSGLLKIYGRVSLTGIPEYFEIFLEALQMWFAVSVYSPQKGYFAAVFDVITERKRIEGDLRESRNFLMSIIDQSPFPTWISDDRGTLIKLNRACRRLLHITEEEVVGKYNVFNDDMVIAQGYLPLVKSVFEKGEIASFELYYDSSRIEHLSLGKTVIAVLEVTVFPIRNSNGVVTNAVIQHYNITDRRRFEAELRDSEERFRTLVENLLDGFAIFSAVRDDTGAIIDFRYEYINDAGCRLNQRQRGEQIGHTLLELLPAHRETGLFAEFAQVVETGQPFARESCVYEDIYGGGQKLMRAFDLQVVKLGDGLVTSWRDVTPRKQADEKIHNLLREKELFLKEVHHRIKNNINTIISLLTIQANTEGNPAVKSILQETAGRVQGMWMLYDKLYSYENTHTVSIGNYLPALINEMVSIFPGRGNIKIRTHIDDITLGAHIISPLGIIIYELITNAMKYAFPGRNDGVITISASGKNGHVVFSFEDNGPGIPGGITINNSPGFGLQLVGMLAKQINGSVKIEERQGTRFILEFPV